MRYCERGFYKSCPKKKSVYMKVQESDTLVHIGDCRKVELSSSLISADVNCAVIPAVIPSVLVATSAHKTSENSVFLLYELFTPQRFFKNIFHIMLSILIQDKEAQVATAKRHRGPERWKRSGKPF